MRRGITPSILRCAPHEGPRHRRRRLHRLGGRRAAARRAATTSSCSTTSRAATPPRCRPAPQLVDGVAARPRRARRRRSAGVDARAALRRALARRRVGRAPRALLAQQRRSARATCSTRCAPAGVGRLVFSSTAATYGEPETIPIDEDDPTAPVNAYGETKLAVDLMIRDECVAHGLAAASLRYFNVAGASGALRRGPRARDAPDPARPAGRRRRRATTSRSSAPTTRRRDGTASATTSTSRTSARRTCSRSTGSSRARTAIFNLGSGDGYSVREVIEAARAVTGARDPRARGGPPRRATRRSWSPPTRAPAPSWAGRPSRGLERDDRRRLGLAPGAPATATAT